MQTLDWIIVTIPLFVVFYIAVKAQRYVKSVSDFLAAGRVAGRYVVSVAGAEAGMGLISLVGLFEFYYASGFAISFWNQLTVPLGMVILLTGYCIYRYRETRAMTMGQFFEIRYNRSFRIFAAILQSISGVINYAIFPAVGARFLIYFLELPLSLDIGGLIVPTFGLVMAIFLLVALIIVSMGGQITIMVTDCIQGILSYPLYAIIVVYILFQYSWFDDMAPALLDRPEGQSMLNPFDTSKLRDFNLFYIMVGIFSSVFNRMSWSGSQGYNAAALNAHEQKMGAVLGTWRAGFSFMMYILLAAAAFTFLNNAKFSEKADAARMELTVKAMEDVASGPEFQDMRADMHAFMASDQLQAHLETASVENPDDQEPLMTYTKDMIASENASKAQTFGAIYGQMRVPMALKHMLPTGVLGIFCALCIFLLISTDTTYMHSWGSIIVQDIMVPLRGKALTPVQQLRLLRISIAGVAAFAWFFSFFFAQVDFILMFFAITGAIWLGGAGPCIVGGLYWNRGTAAGAFAALITGSSLSVAGIFAQKKWVDIIYPWLESTGRIEGVTRVLESFSKPFEPFIEWRVTPDQFPINSQEMYFITLVLGVGLYIAISLLTCRTPFNMERMLHRGKYHRAGEHEVIQEKLTFRNLFKKLLGIDSQYTRGDTILAWSVFFWAVGWGFGSFVILLIWNSLSPWPDAWWVNWFFIANIVIPGIVAVISTVWFTIGGIVDLRRLFQRLEEKEENVLDDGRVIGHMNADDAVLADVLEDHPVAEGME